jgi:predicted transcriptional regulator
LTTVVVKPAGFQLANPSIGDQELALMRWLAERDGATVGEAAVAFGADRGLARSTILTMMERLRAKGHLKRHKKSGVFRYRCARAPEELLQGVVRRFVERTLDGSVSPVVAYLAESEELTPDELGELETLVARLRSRRAED